MSHNSNSTNNSSPSANKKPTLLKNLVKKISGFNSVPESANHPSQHLHPRAQHSSSGSSLLHRKVLTRFGSWNSEEQNQLNQQEEEVPQLYGGCYADEDEDESSEPFSISMVSWSANASCEEPEFTMTFSSDAEASAFIVNYMIRYRTRRRFQEYVRKDPDLRDARLRVATINEIIATERSYVNLLTICLKYFMDPLSTKKLLDEDELLTIFSNMKQIKFANEAFLADMEEGILTMGQLFKKMSPFLKIYTEYVKNFDESSALVDELEAKNKKFAHFLEKTGDLPEVRKSLASFLILPVQRIPRYRLLLQELIKRTPKDHVDYTNLTVAENEISKVATFVNERKRKDLTDNMLIALQEALSSRFKDILMPHRCFVQKGSLIVDESESQYDAYLYNDVLILTPSASSGKIQVENAIALFFAFCEVLEEDDLSIVIRTIYNNNPTVYVLKAVSPTECTQWKEMINSNIAALHQSIKKKLGQNVDLADIRDQRSHLFTELKYALENQIPIELNLESTFETLNSTQIELCQLEDQAKSVWQRLQKTRLELKYLESKYEALLKENSRVNHVIPTHTISLRQCDETILKILNHDEVAFKEVFGDNPKTRLKKDTSEENLATRAHQRTASYSSDNIVINDTEQFLYEEVEEVQVEEEDEEQEEITQENILFQQSIPEHWTFIERERLVPKYLVDRQYFSQYELLTPTKRILPDASSKSEEDDFIVDTSRLSTPLEFLPSDVREYIEQLKQQTLYWKDRYTRVMTDQSADQN